MNKKLLLFFLPIAFCFSLPCTKTPDQCEGLSFKHFHQTIPEIQERFSDENAKKPDPPSASILSGGPNLFQIHRLFTFRYDIDPPGASPGNTESARAPPDASFAKSSYSTTLFINDKLNAS
jgi:hypothetical protein